jgi:hypothetical protein
VLSLVGSATLVNHLRLPHRLASPKLPVLLLSKMVMSPETLKTSVPLEPRAVERGLSGETQPPFAAALTNHGSMGPFPPADRLGDGAAFAGATSFDAGQGVPVELDASLPVVGPDPPGKAKGSGGHALLDAGQGDPAKHDRQMVVVQGVSPAKAKGNGGRPLLEAGQEDPLEHDRRLAVVHNVPAAKATSSGRRAVLQAGQGDPLVHDKYLRSPNIPIPEGRVGHALLEAGQGDALERATDSPLPPKDPFGKRTGGKGHASLDAGRGDPVSHALHLLNQQNEWSGEAGDGMRRVLLFGAGQGYLLRRLNVHFFHEAPFGKAKGSEGDKSLAGGQGSPAGSSRPSRVRIPYQHVKKGGKIGQELAGSGQGGLNQPALGIGRGKNIPAPATSGKETPPCRIKYPLFLARGEIGQGLPVAGQGGLSTPAPGYGRGKLSPAPALSAKDTSPFRIGYPVDAVRGEIGPSLPDAGQGALNQPASGFGRAKTCPLVRPLQKTNIMVHAPCLGSMCLTHLKTIFADSFAGASFQPGRVLPEELPTGRWLVVIHRPKGPYVLEREVLHQYKTIIKTSAVGKRLMKCVTYSGQPCRSKASKNEHAILAREGVCTRYGRPRRLLHVELL